VFSYSSVSQESSRQVFLCVGINLLICRSTFYKRDKVVLQVFALFLVSFPCLQQVVLLSLILLSIFVGVTEEEHIDAFLEKGKISFYLLSDQWNSSKFKSGFLNFREYGVCC